uniref:Uncharacterized protein n=1 Tax=Lotharella oceanica TaxID=641309 RepID=A0A7S2U1G6_9EUKA|mmetsp:Transcript_5711/g.11327  ORF Transcript_5711/g.11327 Transcript_5711/m.11327 type:complete len:306 (+) Transcript_5711:40-957(+)
MASKRILLGGGKGFLGRALRKALEKKGHKVTVVSRTADAAASVTSWEALKEEGLPDSDVIINLAGAPILDMKKPWTDKYKKECEDSRTDTTATLATLAAEAKKKPEVFIATSAVGYYPYSATAKYDENYVSCGETDGWGAKLCHMIEDAAQPAADAGIRTVAMRMGVIMGRGGGAYAEMKFPFSMGVGGPFGDGKQWFPWIHLEDAAALYDFAIEHEKVSGPLNATSPGATSNGAFCNALASAMWRPCLFQIPGFALNLIGEDRAKILLEGQHVVPKKALANGFTFKYRTAGACCDELVNGQGEE